MPKTEKAKEQSYAIVFQGKTYNRTPYTVSINVLGARIDEIKIIGKPNLFIADLCAKFAIKKPANIDDVANIIKLEMLKHNEYVKEIRQ